MKRLWASSEVDQSSVLRMLGAALSFYCYLTWCFWFDHSQLSAAGPTQANYVPVWPFAGLGWTLVGSEVETRLGLQLLGLSSLAAMLAFAQARDTLGAMLLLSVNLLAKTFFYLHDLTEIANFHQVHLYVGFFFLGSRNKLFWVRWSLVLIYWMAALAKLTPSWLQGGYFSSVPARLPLLASDPAAITFWCRVLIAQEFLGPLLWFAPSRRVRQASVAVFVLFHLYSGVIVGFWYTSLMLPLVLLACWDFPEPLQRDYRWHRRDPALWGASLLLALGAALPFWIPGDVRETAEGRYTGLFMFDANRRVRAHLEVRKGTHQYQIDIEYDWPRRGVLDWSTRITLRTPPDEEHPEGNSQTLREPLLDEGVVIFHPGPFRRASSRMFGDPYFYYYWARELQKRYHPERISLRLVQQLDGSPDETLLLDIPDFEALAPEYRALHHNDWISP